MRYVICTLAALSFFCLSNVVAALSESTQDSHSSPSSTLELSTDNLSRKPNLRFHRHIEKELNSVGLQYAIVQDQQGFIWFAGDQGLTRFDGYNYIIFRHEVNNPNSLSHNHSLNLLVDQEGMIWIATIHGLNRLDPATEQFTHFFHEANNKNSLGSNFIQDVIQDRQGTIWVATWGGGLAKINPNNLKVERVTLPISENDFKIMGRHDLIQNEDLANIKLDKLNALSYSQENNTLWLGARSSKADIGGLGRYNIQKQSFTFYPYIAESHVMSPSSFRIKATDIDQEGSVWVATDNRGLNVFNPSSLRFLHFRHNESIDSSLSDDKVNSLLVDSDNHIWVGADSGGLNRLDRRDLNKQFRNQTQTKPVNPYIFQRYRHDANFYESIGSDNVWAIYEDRQKGIWFGLFPSGASKLNNYATAFTPYFHEQDNKNSLSHNAALALTQANDNQIWIGTPVGVNRMDMNTDTIIRENESHPSTISSILAIFLDSQNNLWIGTWAGGLFKRNLQTGKQVHYLNEPNNKHTLVDNNIWQITEDRNGDIWIGGHTGLNRYTPATDSFKRYTHQPNDPTSIPAGLIRGLYEDRQGQFWVGSNEGVSQLDRDTGEFTHFKHDGTPASISPGQVVSILETSDGNLWFGLIGGGLNRYDRKSGAFTHFGEIAGLPDANVTCLVEDHLGALWGSTWYGIFQFNQSTEKFKHFTEASGLAGNKYTFRSCLKAPNNQLLFGSDTGLTAFSPEALFSNRIAPPVAITNFKLFNKTVLHEDPLSPIDKKINLTDHITLTHDQSVFSFEFSALNFYSPEKNQFAYKLEGFDKQWIFSGTRRMTTYTNLDHGRYTFRVKASNNEGVWNEQGTAIDIHVLPPWWLTWWAWMSYGIITIGLVALLVYTLLQRKRAADEFRVNNRLRDLDKLKDSFLANTSHELRTPLNGIIGLSESLLQGATGTLSPATSDNLELIVSSSKRLSYLIDDILDFSKLKEHTLRLVWTATHIHSLVNSVIRLSSSLVGSKPVTLENHIDPLMSPVLADENRLQQILYNLIGNAIKFTERGKIIVSANIDGDTIWISVHDTGVGIPEDKLNHVFEEFQQAADEDDDHQLYVGGTGLGLAVTKKLVELHGGEIKLTSTLGKGTTVTFSLKQEDQLVIQNSPEKTIAHATEYTTQASQGVGDTDKNLNSYAANDNTIERDYSQEEPKGHILVVDDEPVNRRVLQNLLKLHHYKITECTNGQDALELLNGSNDAHDIDLILLDVMMPGLSGYEVCEKIRQTHPLNELPIIFLTAKTQVRDLEEGYACGGNDYLTKPISKEEFYARIDTHLKLKHTLEEWHTAKISADHANAAKSDFLARMSHEIRTPINIILGFTELLGDVVSGEKPLLYVNSIRTGGQTLLRLINDILDLSKVEAGKLELRYAPTSLKNLFQDLNLIFSQDTEKKGVKFNANLATNVPALLLLDDTRIQQILINLIGNAIKFTQKGHISVQASCSFPNKQGNVNLTLVVEDTGIGIPESQQQKIFSAFEQVEGQDISQYGGTGLGLSICVKIVDLMKGKIHLDSSSGKGSRFQIDLPNIAIPKEVQSDKQKMESLRFKPAKILIADDVDFNRMLLIGYLQAHPFTFIEASNGVEALSLVDSEQPDLIILDMMMPEMDGYEVSAQLRKRDRPSPPIIAVSAAALDEEQAKIKATCDSCLIKPIARNQLETELANYLPQENGIISELEIKK